MPWETSSGLVPENCDSCGQVAHRRFGCHGGFAERACGEVTSQWSVTETGEATKFPSLGSTMRI